MVGGLLEFRFAALKQPLYVAAVLVEYEQGDTTSGEHPGEVSAPQRGKDGDNGRGKHGTGGDVTPDCYDGEPYDTASQQRQGQDGQQGPQRSGDAFAPVETVVQGEDVTKDGAQSSRSAEDDRTPPPLRQQHGNQAFRTIPKERQEAGCFPEGARYVGGTNVATTAMTWVRSPVQTGQEQTKGDGPQQVCKDQQPQISQHRRRFQRIFARYLRR